ncbi:hypothetical protein N3K66_005518 [Trichothecium roseum]|uniref:Uncharacterized protein n=1 Tax=Trichothecium roseum TaxID=47278 RepID=A0ACC0UZZ4_9HYPO|nr:hypothetical protein N3K66_005518 [Trichothecium roseum]
MAENAGPSSDAQITFKVKASSDKTHTMTMSEGASVKDLKEKLATEEYENIPAERQRLIYSGRVMKNDDTLATYKIKPNNTIHLVKSAASNPGQPAASSNPTSQQSAPVNMSAGTANNPLAGLTGARYAGHGINLPGMDMFGPDGGMVGNSMDPEHMQRMMEDPSVQQQLREALDNPDFINMLINSNPMLRNMPNAREIISSPMMRQMMTSPQMMRSVMNMNRGAGAPSFPAPGATDNAPTGGNGEANAASDGSNQPPGAQQPFNPFLDQLNRMGAGGNGGSGGQPNMNDFMGMMSSMMNNVGPSTTGAAAVSGDQSTGTEQGQAQGQNASQAPPANPFAALFPGGAGGAGGFGGQQGNNPFGITPEMMQQMQQMMGGMGGFGGFGGAPAAPPDTRPPEERFADELRQLNDMGFFNFDRNIEALRRSGGSVQGAVEYLLTSVD